MIRYCMAINRRMRQTARYMASRIHQVEQLKSNTAGIEAMTLISNHHFPRHSHDQFGIGVIASGAHRSWSGIGQVEALAGDTIMVNPGEMHDGAPLDSNARTWQMLYFSPELVIDQVKEDLADKSKSCALLCMIHSCPGTSPGSLPLSQTRRRIILP